MSLFISVAVYNVLNHIMVEGQCEIPLSIGEEERQEFVLWLGKKMTIATFVRSKKMSSRFGLDIESPNQGNTKLRHY